MNVSFINSSYRRFYAAHKEEIIEVFDRCASTGTFILGPDVEKFEENLAKFVGTKYAVGLNSGTDAIYLSIKALGIKGKIALPSHTFKSTCGAIINAGADPIIYDIGEDWRYKWEECQAQIPVHISGELSEIIDAGILIIEDACQALGAVKNPTTFTQCWSFYPAKILGAYGDAGAITTNNEMVADYIREARNHFKKDNRNFGGNHRMDNIQAAILNVKFKYIDEFLARRKEIAYKYKALKGVELPKYVAGRVWQDYIVRTPERDKLYDYLKENGIETMKNEYPWSKEYPKLPLAAKYESETLRLPCNPDLEDIEVEYIIEKINEFYA